jgi:hypothetical protein
VIGRENYEVDEKEGEEMSGLSRRNFLGLAVGVALCPLPIKEKPKIPTPRKGHQFRRSEIPKPLYFYDQNGDVVIYLGDVFETGEPLLYVPRTGEWFERGMDKDGSWLRRVKA